MKSLLALRQGLITSIYSLAGVVLMVVAWSAVKYVANPQDYLLPSPLQVWQATLDNWSDLALNAWITSGELVLGFALAVVIGLACAIAIHTQPAVGKILWPVVLIAQITPQVAFAPLLITWLGLGLTSKVVIAGLIAFFPVLVNAWIGFQSIEPATTDLARSMLANRWTYFFQFEWPAALPHILSGLKIAMTYAVVGAVVSEFISSNSGLGNAILVANGALDTAAAIAAVIILSLIGVAFFLVLSVIERVLTPWQVSLRQSPVAQSRI